MLWNVWFFCDVNLLFPILNLPRSTQRGEQFWISENIDVIDWSLRNMSFMTIITKSKKVAAYSCCIIAWLNNGSWEIDVIWTRPPGKLEESHGTFWGVGIPESKDLWLGVWAFAKRSNQNEHEWANCCLFAKCFLCFVRFHEYFIDAHWSGYHDYVHSFLLRPLFGIHERRCWDSEK